MADEPVYDGQGTFDGGQDSSLPPSRLPENKFAAGVNITTKKGVIRPRYGFERKALKFPPGGYSYKFNKIADFKYLFETGKFQAMIPYKIGSKAHIIIVVSGVIFLVNEKTFNVQVLTLNQQTQLNESVDRVHWTIAGKYVVLYDFPSRPIIIEGSAARRSSVLQDEVPVSNLGAYAQGRLFFSNYGNEFSAGDPVGNDLTPDAPITAVEILLQGSPYYADIYQMPSEYNAQITAMAKLQAVDGSTDIGQIITATRKEIYSYDIKESRDTWLPGKFGKSISDAAGIAGSRAFKNVNSDLYFVSDDGQLRSLSVARDEQRKWSRVPMNVEVENWISYISKDLVKYSVIEYFKNKIFWTVRPYRIPASRLDGSAILDVAHSGILVLELDNVSRLGADAAPAWAGLWTGLRPMDMCVTNERMYVMSKEYYSRNALYEVDPELKFDKNEKGVRRMIQSTLYTRDHTFGDLFSLKDLQNIELGISDIEGDFKLDIDYKPAHSSNFLYWSTFHHKVPSSYTDISDGQIPQKQPLAFPELKFGCPESDEGHPVTDDVFDKAKRVRFRFIMSGEGWQLNEYRITAVKTEVTNNDILVDIPEKTQLMNSYTDWTYEEFGL